jgi:DNA sulfur modification protein DndB
MPDYVPALQARMGDWKYYVTVMKIGKIARECRLAEEIHTDKDLDDLIQRAITDRVAKEMVPYLLNEPQRFYGALVVAVYGGEPEFSLVRVDEHELLDDKDRSSYGFGLLRFDGSQVYYALDGQHRLKSMQEAIRMQPDLAKEEITVIILKHEESTEGLRRTRRLFSTLNRTAKPTSSGMNIAIDEDDAVAIVTRRLVKESDILKGMVSNTLGSKQINPGKKNDPYITILPALYEVNEILLSAYNEGMQIDNKFKQFRPSDDNLDEYYLFLENIWREMLNCCPDFNYVKSGNKKPGELRLLIDSDGLPVFDDEQKVIPGGNVFMRPIGQYVIAEVVKQAGIQRKSIPEVIQAIMTNVSMDIDNAPWVGLIWNRSKRTIVGTKKEQAIIVAIICHALGLKKPHNVKSKKSLKVRDLKQEYRDMIGDPKASLLQPIDWSGRITQIHEKDEEEENI